jgi:polysaccharide chain length determinant protein (PEP-CTERM system associated)
MKEMLEALLEHARGAWRYRGIAIATAWGVALLLWLAILAWPDSYRAQARVYVDTSMALRPLLAGLAVDQDVEARLNIVREQMLGPDKLERVAHDAGFFQGEPAIAEKAAVLEELRNGIFIDSTMPSSARRDRAPTSDRIFTIMYEDGDRDRALTVVTALLKTLVDDTRSGATAGANEAQGFLEQQLKEAERDLRENEARQAAFKKNNVGLVPGEEQSDFFSRLQTEITAGKRTENALDLALRRRAELTRQLNSEQPFSPGATGAAGGRSTTGGTDTASRIADTQARIDELLLRFTEKHGDVIAARQTLADLKARQQEELEAFRRGDTAAIANSGLAANPVYQSIQLQANQTDVEIAALRGELNEHRRQEAELRRLLTSAPQIEAEYAQIMRDYVPKQLRYTSLLERLEKAKLSDDASETALANFDPIEPPNASDRPSFPPRSLLLLVSLVVALGAGVGLALLLMQLRPVFTSAASLAGGTGLPVLGVVTEALTDKGMRESRSRQLRFGTAVAGLLGAFVLVFLMHEPGSRLIQGLLSA